MGLENLNGEPILRHVDLIENALIEVERETLEKAAKIPLLIDCYKTHDQIGRARICCSVLDDCYKKIRALIPAEKVCADCRDGK